MRKNLQFSKNKKRIIPALVVSATALATLGACAPEEPGTGYVLPANVKVEVGTEYVPDFSLSEGVTATLVDLFGPETSRAEIEDGAFTPDTTGVYEYVVRFKQVSEAGVVETEERVSITAIDTVAPEISEMADKTTETGLYTELGEDLADAVVTDNCAETVTVYAESVTFNGEVTELGKGVAQIRLSKVGDYEIKVVAEDYSGNKSSTTYTLTAEDTTAPVIDGNAYAIAWAKDGKVSIPVMNITDMDAHTCVASVKNSLDETVELDAEGKFVASAGVYTVTYVATDASGNESSRTVSLIVKEAGVISDFTVAGEESVWNGDISRVQNGALKVHNLATSVATLEYADGFTLGEWNNYKAFEAEVENERGVPLTVSAEFLVDGVWQATAGKEIDATDTLRVFLSDYGIEKVEGVRLVFACDGGVIASVKNVKTTTVAEEDRTFPAWEEYAISANKAVQIAVDENNADGVVIYTIYANVACTVKTGLHYENGSVYSVIRLQAGENRIVRYPNAESGADLVSSKLESMSIANVSAYGVKVYVSELEYEAIGDVALDTYAEVNGAYTVAYGETFAIPTPFKVSSGWYNELTVSVYQGATAVKEFLSIGSALVTEGDGALGAGDYEIVYTFKDIAGVEREIRYDLTVEPNYLNVAVTPTALFANENGVTLPSVIITSSEYGDETVQNESTLTVYYRTKGKKAWNVVTESEPFMPRANEWCEIRFAVEYAGHYKEIKIEKFIHVNDYTIDFEPEDAVGMDANYREYLKGDTLPDGSLATADSWQKTQSRFYFDGGYYDYRPGRTDNRFLVYSGWSKSGNYSISAYSPRFNGVAAGLYIRPMIVTGSKGVNAVSFWAKADGKITPNFELGTGGDIYGQKWYQTEPLTIEQGEGYYTLYLKTPIPVGEKISLFYMGRISQGNRVSFDDLQFHYVNRVTAEDTNTYEDQIDNTEGYELTAPLMTSDLLTVEELAKANIVLSYSYEKGEYVELAPNAEGKYILKLERGGFVKFKWVISYENVWTSETTDKFTWSFESDEVLIGKARMQAEHEELVLKGDELKLGAPTCDAGEMSDIKFEYRASGTSEWTEVVFENDEYVIPTDTVGWIDIRYSSTVKISDTLTVEGIYLGNIYVRDPEIFIDFEGSDPYSGGIAYFDSSYSKGTFPGSEIVAVDETNNHAQKILMNENAWEGIYWATAKVLDKPYTTIRLRIYAEKAVENYRIELWQGSGGWPECTVNLEAGWNDVIVSFPEFTQLRALIFKMVKDGSLPIIMIDDIKLLAPVFESEVPTTGRHQVAIELPTATIEGVNAVISYRVKGAEEWTTIEDGTSFVPTQIATYEVRYAFEGYLEKTFEIEVGYNTDVLGAEHADVVLKGANVTLSEPTSLMGTLSNIKVEAKAYGTEDWVELTAVTGGYTFPTTKVGSYRLRYTATITTTDGTMNGEYQSDIYVRDPSVFIDFEGSDPYAGGVAYFDSRGGGKFPGSEIVAVDETNNHVQKLLMKEDSADGIYWANAIQLGKTYTQMRVRLYAEEAIEGYRVEISPDNNNWPACTVDLEAGWNDVILTFTEFSQLRAIAFKTAKNGKLPIVMIDDIQLISMEFSDEVPEKVSVEKEVTLPTVTCAGVTATLSYRVKGTEEWTDTNGTFTPTEVGVYEIRYAFEDMFDYVMEIQVTYNVTYSSDIPTTAKIGDVVTIPTATAGSEVGKTFYRVYGEEAWMEGGSFTAEQSGVYEICYRFDCIEEDIVYNVIVRDDSVFMDFEGDDPLLGGKSYFQLANPNHALKGGTVVELEDGSHAIQFPALWSTGGWWDGFGWSNNSYNQKDLGGSYTKVSIKIYAPKALSGVYFYFLFDSGAYEKTINLDAGWQTVEFNLGKTVTKASYLCFNTKPEHGGMLWDDVKFYNA